MRNWVFLVEQMFRQRFLDDFLDAKFLDGPVLHVGGVLRGNHNVGNAHGLVIHVLDRNLTFGIGPEPFHLAGLADAREFAAKLVRIHDGRGHKLRRLVRGVAEHQSLVAGALLGGVLAFGRARVHALRDVRRLRRDGVHDQHLVGVKNVVVVRIADVANGLARDGVEIELGLGRDFAADHDEIALGVGLAGDAAVFVLRQAGVQHVIGNGVANLVRMAFADGLRRKNKVFTHSI